MRPFVLLFLALMFVAPHAASGACASATPGTLAVWNYIKVQKSPNLPPAFAQAVDQASYKWASECGTGHIPEFWVSPYAPPGPAALLNVGYNSGISPTFDVCGTFSGTDITLYQYYRKQNNSTRPCTDFSLTDIVAHEFGHRLGLNHPPGDETGCDSNIMALLNGLDHSVSQEECAAANSRNSTFAERNGGCDTLVDCHMSPIVLKLDGGPWQFTSLEEGVVFDYDGDGLSAQTAWTAPGQRLAFLFTDLDGDGCVSNGRELFGDSTEVPGIGTYINGFEALMPWDTNRDAWITPADQHWSRLRLWIDGNHDGLCTAAEVDRLLPQGVFGISLDYREHRRVDAHGNEFRLKSQGLFLRPGGLALRPVFDIFFRAVPD